MTLTRAALVSEVTNDQTVVLLPPASQRFLWVTAVVAGAPQTSFDLTRVAVEAGTAAFPLIGVDSTWGGDPKQFSMIAPATMKKGGRIEPLEETRSVGTVSFAFTPGRQAILRILIPPQSVCLLFSVPDSFKTGQIRGLSAQPLVLPVLAAR